MLNAGCDLANSRVACVGLAFKENVGDLRNTRVVDIVRHASNYNMNVDVYDPWVDAREVHAEYGIALGVPISFDRFHFAAAHEVSSAVALHVIGRHCHVLHVMVEILDLDLQNQISIHRLLPNKEGPDGALVRPNPP